MKKLYSLPGIVISILFVFVGFYFVDQSIKESDTFKKNKQEIAEVLNFNDRLLSTREWISPDKEWQEKRDKAEYIIAEADKHYQNAVDIGYLILFACLIYIVVMVLIYARTRMYFGITMALTSVALVLLIQGIYNPILEMGAFKQELTVKFLVQPDDIPYYDDAVQKFDKAKTYTSYLRMIPMKGNDWANELDAQLDEGKQYLVGIGSEEYGVNKIFEGRTYFYYQNKGIMDVIKLLFDHDNKPVAIAIGTFSIIIPSLKLFLTFFILILPFRGLKRMRRILSYISKWSMADVFVVALFLAYLSFSNMSPGVQMESNVLFGLYFFGGYVIVSIGLGFLLDASIREKINHHEKSIGKNQELVENQ